MRNIFPLALTLFAFGCSHIDATQNRAPTGTDGYPAGPYGYARGSVIQDLKFIDKTDPAGAAGTGTYAGLALADVSLGDYYANKDVKFIAMSGVAGWCGPCNDEQDGYSPIGEILSVPALQAKWEPKGVRFLEALSEGFTRGTPATEADLNEWQSLHSLHVGIALDVQDKLHLYADIAAFPLNMVIRTSDMSIVYMQTGLDDLDSVLTGLQQ